MLNPGENIARVRAAGKDEKTNTERDRCRESAVHGVAVSDLASMIAKDTEGVRFVHNKIVIAQ